jgi:N-hydroxyarylamine O-acetyltransferase
MPSLSSLILRHITTFPFENLDVHLGKRILLDVPVLVNKLVRSGRGGFCYEHNGLFHAVLTALGYAVYPVGSRPCWQRPRGGIYVRSHVCLVVTLDGVKYLVDVGMSYGPLAPLRMEFEVEQQTYHERRRLHRDASANNGHGRQWLQLWHEDAWADVVEFELAPLSDTDRDMGSWFAATHPDSRVRQRLILGRVRASDLHRVHVVDRTFTVSRGAQVLQKREIASEEELLEVLRVHFGLHFPSGTRFQVLDYVPLQLVQGQQQQQQARL